ncbi:uncharacterized protein LOC131631935 [Vicia villosa]|uniref:uncharacterized protein LOC131631935 n=1 Tax=Vicia villosa TaxID=3911 RepID=UPI00273C6C3D|nr:uncharacterized protein LOC131631935 [Vicia villosa]
MTGQNGKRKAPSSTNKLCRQRQIPPGSIAIKNSRMVHGKPGSKNPPPPHTQKKHPPPIQTTKTPLPTQPSPSIQTKPTPPPTQPPPPIQTKPTPPPTQPLPPIHTNPTPPFLHPPSKTRKNPTPPPSQPASTTHTNPTPPLAQTNPTPPPINQPQPSIPTSEEFRFIPTPGYTHHVLQSPPHHTSEEDVQEEGDQALSNEEQQEQDDGQRPKIYIVEDTNAGKSNNLYCNSHRLTTSNIEIGILKIPIGFSTQFFQLSPGNLVAEMCRKVIVKLYKGTFFSYSELKRDEKQAERKEWFNMFKSLVSWDRCDDTKMEGLFHQRCAARLRDILQKAKDQARKPPWMGVDTWEFLLAKWETKEFKDVSKQNKIN